MSDLNCKVEEAIRILRKFKEYPVTVLYSGGKDSTAALLLTMLAGLKYVKIVYVEITGNTCQECTEYVYNVCEKFEVVDKLKHIRPQYDFYDLLRKYGPPGFKVWQRWCYQRYKLNIWKQYCTKVVVTGVKRSDRITRKNARLIQDFVSLGAISINPIVEFMKEEVYDLLKEYGIQINPCYEKYGHSGNCMFCPFHDAKAIKKTLADLYWCEKIINALKQCNCRLKIGRLIIERWLRYV